MQIDFGRISQREHRSLDIDLDGADSAVLRQEFGPRKAGPDHQQRVAALHQVPARLGAEQSDGAGDERKVVRKHVFAQKRLRDAGTEKRGRFDQQRRRSPGSGADQDRHLAAGVQDVRRFCQVGVLGHDLRLAVADARSRKAVRDRRLLVVLILNVLWKDDDGWSVVGLRHPDAPIDQMAHLGRCRGLLRETGDVREHAVEVEFLLVARAPDGCFGLAAYRQHRRVIQLGVIQACDQVGSARAAGRQTDAKFAGELGVGNGHEGRHLLMPNLHEFDLVGPLQGSNHAVDAVARISVDPANSPLVQAFNDEITDFHGELRCPRGAFD